MRGRCEDFLGEFDDLVLIRCRGRQLLRHLFSIMRDIKDILELPRQVCRRRSKKYGRKHISDAQLPVEDQIEADAED